MNEAIEELALAAAHLEIAQLHEAVTLDQTVIDNLRGTIHNQAVCLEAYHQQDTQQLTAIMQQATAIIQQQTAIELLREACVHAKLFIQNGVELGFIHMPDRDDPAWQTEPLLDAALAASQAEGEAKA